MAKTNTTTSPATDEIAVLKDQLAKLRQQQADATEEAKYDQLQSEITTVEKAISLAEARRRQAEKEAAELARKQALEQYAAGLKQLDELNQEGKRLDQMLFIALKEFYRIYNERWTDAERAAQLAEILILQAVELGVAPPPRQMVTVANMPLNGHGREKGALEVLHQYGQAWGALEDAHRAGQEAPDEPGIDWYHKGQGQFWPR